MAESSDKVPIALVGPDDVEFCSPPVSPGVVQAQGKGVWGLCHRLRALGARWVVTPHESGDGGACAGAAGPTGRCDGEVTRVSGGASCGRRRVQIHGVAGGPAPRKAGFSGGIHA